PPAPGEASPPPAGPTVTQPAGTWAPPPPPGQVGGTPPSAPGGGSPPAAPGAGAPPGAPSAAGGWAPPPPPGQAVAAGGPAAAPLALTPKPTSERTELYVCTGCGIGDAVDADRLAALGDTQLQRPGHVAGPLCIPEGLAALRDGLATAEADRVVIAACSERVNHDVFSPAALGVGMVGRVNIRELVAWSKPPGAQETQLLAEDYVRMGTQRLLWSRS